MNAAAYLELSLALLQNVLAAAKASGAALAVIQNLEAAIASLMSVQGSEVTFKQMEDLRVKLSF